MRDKFTVFYLTDVPFPDGGMAAGNRITHVCRAMINEGFDVHVLTLLSDSKRIESLDINGIHYHSLSDRVSWFGRNMSRYLLFYLSALRFISRHRSSRMAIYCYGINAMGTMLAYCIAKIMRCPLIREGCEFPYAIISNGSRWNVFWQVKVLRLFDGVLVMTEKLREYYQSRIKKHGRVILVPMTVEWNKFAECSKTSPFEFSYIAYTGNMNRIGGGVDVLVKSFAIIASKYPDLHLVLIGRGSDSLKQELEALLPASTPSSDSLVQRFHCLFSGTISTDEMPRYICNAKILALLPLPTKQQEGCFPTKLGEYLSSGIPAVVSKVGNPAKCLTDRQEVYFVPPNDPETTARVFDEILSNYSVAQAIGKVGQKYAREHFNYLNHAQALKEWYEGF